MLKPILLAACLAVPGTALLAQSDTPAPDAQAGPDQSPTTAPEMTQDRAGPRDDGPKGRGPGEGRGGGHGMGMMMRHHPEMMAQMAGKGFVLDLGDDRSLRVNCGDETMAECLDAMRPVIDQMPSLSTSQ